MKPWKMRSFVAVLGSVADDRRWQENSSKCVMKTAHKTEGSSLIETVGPSTSSWVHQDMRKGATEGISFHGAIIPLFSVLWACVLTVSSYLLLQVIFFDIISVSACDISVLCCMWHLCSMGLPVQKFSNPSSTMTRSESNGEMCGKLRISR